MSIATLQQIKEYLREQGDSADGILSNILTREEKALKNIYTGGRDIESNTYTEYHDGGDSNALVVKQYPIISVTSLNDDPSRLWGASTLIASTDYVVYNKEGIIKLDGFNFADSVGNVKVVYVGGYAAVPEDIKHALIQLCVAEYMDVVGISNIVEKAGVIYKPDQLRKNADRIIDGYRKIR